MDLLDRLENIEDKFFDNDDQNRITTVYLQYDKVSDLFNPNYKSKQPLVNGDLLEMIKSVFQSIPSHYKLSLDIQIDDSEGYSEQELLDIFTDNILFEYKNKHREISRRNKTAIRLVLIGLFFLVMMLTAGHIWPDKGLAHDIFFYVSDIAATVTIWEALTITIIQIHEKRLYEGSLLMRFAGINIHTGKKAA
jgi:hypothetical protein